MIIRRYKGKRPRIGDRVFIADNAALIGDLEVADDCSIWFGTVLRADVNSIRVGARTNIQDNCVVHVTNDTAPTVIGEEVTIGHSVVVHGCTIERGALIGMGSRVLDGAVIGEGALVGAGALVPEGLHVPPHTLAIGVPARIKRELTAEEVARLDEAWRHYIEYKVEYLKDPEHVTLSRRAPAAARRSS
jgi:carbonic anhydrase/acetyltransferase-like protein (isoleucine patch superfamily)